MLRRIVRFLKSEHQLSDGYALDSGVGEEHDLSHFVKPELSGRSVALNHDDFVELGTLPPYMDYY